MIENYSLEEEKISSWDEYFLNLSIQVSRRSKCFSRRVGAVLVKDKSIIGTGYNGPPRGIPPCDRRWEIDKEFRDKYNIGNVVNKPKDGLCPRYVVGSRSGENLDMCIAAHGEENSIVNSARMGVNVKGAKLYLNCGVPCGNCMIKIINAGIEEVIVTSMHYYDAKGKYLLDNSDIKIRLYNF
jgi:dCMP deaminase